MSKIFDAIKQAEADRHATERKNPETVAFATLEDAGSRTGNSGNSASSVVLQCSDPAAQNPSTAPHLLQAGTLKRGEVILMSKVFYAVKQAEPVVAGQKHAEPAAAPAIENSYAPNGGFNGGGALNSVVQDTKAVVRSSNSNGSLSQLQPGGIDIDDKTDGMAGLLRRIWPRREATTPEPSSTFGDFGTNLESVLKSPFWQWFQFEKTREEKGVLRFESSKSELHSVSYIDVTVSEKNEIRAFTVGVQRKFIDGANEPFARDLVRSFLCIAFSDYRSEAVGQLIDELGSEFIASKPVPGAEGVRRAAVRVGPSQLYLIFVGRGTRGAVESGPFLFEAENSSEGRANWFRLRVRRTPVKKRRAS